MEKMSRYQIEHIGDGTTIIKAQGCDPQIPSLVAAVMPYGDHFNIYIAIGGDLAAMSAIWRGKAFAIRVAKFMLMGCLSRLGKHHRATKNRAAKRAKAQEETI
jgi:hypothetical protein